MTIPAKHYTTTVGTIEITVAPPEYPPWKVDVIIEEQDTNLLLGRTRFITDTEESYPALVEKMSSRQPLMPGRVLVKHTVPGTFIAIVHDISARPICREAWIAAALEKLFREMERRHAGNIAMPLLGVTHGHFPAAEFMDLLYSRLAAVNADFPEKIWLMTSLTEYNTIITFLEYLRRGKPANLKRRH